MVGSVSRSHPTVIRPFTGQISEADTMAPTLRLAPSPPVIVDPGALQRTPLMVELPVSFMGLL